MGRKKNQYILATVRKQEHQAPLGLQPAVFIEHFVVYIPVCLVFGSRLKGSNNDKRKS